MVSNKGEAHWLLIQTYRSGMKQIAQSAWRVFPSEVDMSKVEDAKGVLRAFVDVFGMTIKIGTIEAKFIDSVQVVGSELEVAVQSEVGSESFFSWCGRRDPITKLTTEVGIAYRIDLIAYRAMLRRHGYPV